jgi:molecular chaperone HtpG
MKERSRDRYEGFWKEFGTVFKQGLREDFANTEKIKDLLLFESANGAPGKLLSLGEYLTLMPDSQKEIYFATGEGRQALENAPHLEAFRKAGYDVLFFTDPVDEWLAPDLPEYKGKKLRNVTRGGVDLPEGAAQPETKADSALIAALKGALGDKVAEVKESRRLTDSACCLVYDEHALSPAMERVYKAMGRPVPTAKGTLEINPGHPVIQKLTAVVKADAASAKVGEYAELLYDQALLTAGQPVADLLAFTRRVSQLMADGLA